MKTLDELKQTWSGNQNIFSAQGYNQTSLEKIFKSRVKKHTNEAMQYFWASFVWQILVYSLLSHVIIKYWSDIEMLRLSIGCGLLFVPFTVILLKKFKGIARIKLAGNTVTSLHQYLLQHEALLLSFYQFKKRYEFVLIPLSSAIGTMLIFKLYVPGGIYEHPVGAGTTIFISLLLCAIAIGLENKKRFEQPLHHLGEIMEDFRSES